MMRRRDRDGRDVRENGSAEMSRRVVRFTQRHSRQSQTLGLPKMPKTENQTRSSSDAPMGSVTLARAIRMRAPLAPTLGTRERFAFVCVCVCVCVAIHTSRAVTYLGPVANRRVEGTRLLRIRHVHHHRDVISLEQNPTDGFPRALLLVHLLRVFQHEVHVLVETLGIETRWEWNWLSRLATMVKSKCKRESHGCGTDCRLP